MPVRAKPLILRVVGAVWGAVWPCLGLAVLVAVPVQAQDDRDTAAAVSATGSGPLTATIEVERLRQEVRGDGSPVREFVDARRLEVGEQIYYTIRVTNPGRAPVSGVVVTKRLPYGVEYVPGSAVGPDCKVELSADGGEHYAPAQRGAVAYTHVRWSCQGPLAPGATTLLRFRAIFR